MSELLRCPFCGSEPLIQEIEPHSHGMMLGDFKMPDHPGSFTVECPTEGCCGLIADTMPEVVAAWNRRPAQAPSAPQPVAGDDWITAKVARHLDMQFRNGVTAGWNAGITEDTDALALLKNRVGTRAEYEAAFPAPSAPVAPQPLENIEQLDGLVIRSDGTTLRGELTAAHRTIKMLIDRLEALGDKGDELMCHTCKGEGTVLNGPDMRVDGCTDCSGKGMYYEPSDSEIARAALSVRAEQKPFAYFVQPSSFGPFIECEAKQVGAFPAFRAAAPTPPTTGEA